LYLINASFILFEKYIYILALAKMEMASQWHFGNLKQ